MKMRIYSMSNDNDYVSLAKRARRAWVNSPQLTDDVKDKLRSLDDYMKFETYKALDKEVRDAYIAELARINKQLLEDGLMSEQPVNGVRVTTEPIDTAALLQGIADGVVSKFKMSA